MKLMMTTASLAALTLSMPALSYAQDADPETISTPAETEDEESVQERIVVTGSALRGTPEDAALPVNVYSAQDLELEGSPTALEFAKDLPQSGPTSGEANYFGGAELTGSPAFNLRGLGADKTLTLLNGRRVSENLSNIPGIAVERTEVLKDGAAVIYGADAVGGVVNFITRSGFTGFEASADYKYIDGSDGDYDLGLLGGFDIGEANIMVSAELQHRSRLESEERDFSSRPYGRNPAPWSNLTNIANYTPIASRFALSSYLASPLTGYYQDATQEQCETQGGIYQPNEILGPRCAYGYGSYYNLVEEQDIYRLYGQLEVPVGELMNFHLDVAWSLTDVPKVFGSPSLPTTRGPAPGIGASFQYYVPRENPYVAEWEARSGAGGYAAFVAANPALFGGATVDAYVISLLRPFAHQGNPVGGGGDGFGNPASVENEVFRASAVLDGDLGDFGGPFNDVGFDLALTYNEQNSENTNPDYLGFRLQDALNGFGGPDCNAQDLNPNLRGIQNPAAAGVGGCQYFNPFTSSYAEQPELGLTNPNYVPGTENSDELISWLFDPKLLKETVSSVTLDAVINGSTGIELPGGEIGWAVGAQHRTINFSEEVPSPFNNGTVPCSYPGQTDCGADPFNVGPFGFFAISIPDNARQEISSVFGEVGLPVTDDLFLQAAVRREEFSGDIASTVYKLSGKYQVIEPLAVRASYGTNFQAPPVTLVPGRQFNDVRSYTRGSGAWLGAETQTLANIEASEATAWNVGLIWQSRGVSPDHDFTFILDYFDIETEGEIGELVSHNDLVNFLFGTEGGTETGSAALANCSSPLIDRVTFNPNPGTAPGGACVQGTTSFADFNTIRTDLGNGAGQLTSGIDFSITYRMPVGPGDLTFSSTGTRILELETEAEVLDGVVVNEATDRLGMLNFSSVGFAAPEWRVNTSLNYNLDRHNLRATARYVSELEDERGPVTPLGLQPGTSMPFEEFSEGVDIDSSLRFDLSYVLDVTENVSLSATVENVTDEDPPFVRAELGYDPRIADPLGRTFEIGANVKF